ncbi:MAG: hypothetical protein ILA34_07490 [Bacteroidaceae bacterium]|nr:hypothetical protein [Bacteroidaceae bacterium]
MNRRHFLQSSLAAVVLSRLGGGKAKAASAQANKSWATEGLPVTCENVAAGPNDLKVRFLGTGAAGWKQGTTTERRNSSVLLDGKVLIDLTVSVMDMFPEGCKPEHLFYTHSHRDHYQPLEALKLGVKHVYISETWVDRAKAEFMSVARENHLAVPKFHTLKVGVPVVVEGLSFTPLPANHSTNFYEEQAQIYLVEKGTTESNLGVRLLYATDTGGIMGKASRLAGIDTHRSDITPRPITGFIMEGTMGVEHDDDYRMFNHSTPNVVARIANMLIKTQRYTPPTGQPVYITHIANSLHDRLSQDELNKVLPMPVRAAYDGLEVTFRALS